MNKKKMRVGAQIKAQKGITLIALIITIIVMLILVGVTITVAVNGGLFEYAGRAGKETNEAIEGEQRLAALDDDMTTDELIDYYTREWTPLEDWEYYYGENNGGFQIPEDCVLLMNYIGENKEVNVPNEYIINKVPYKVIIYCNGGDGESAFMVNNLIEEVYISKNVLLYNYDGKNIDNYTRLEGLFVDCGSLKKVICLSNNLESLYGTFNGCDLLEEVIIYSKNINYTGTIFSTVEEHNITIRVPANSTTYETFINAKENNKLAGSYNLGLNSKITIIGF